jgi:putative ABC transport system permease protein
LSPEPQPSVRPIRCRWADLIATALLSLRVHALRAILTMLGIVIGVAAVIVTIGVGAGAQAEIRRQIEALGTNFISLNSGPPRGRGVTPVFLYRDDAEAIRTSCPAVADVVAVQEVRLNVSRGGILLENNFVMGTTANYPRVRRTALMLGRFFDEEEERRATRVAVLGASVARYLFDRIDPVGAEIRIYGQHFAVIGVLAEKGEAPGLGPGVGIDDRVFVPLSTIEKRLLGLRTLRAVFLQAVVPEQIAEAARQTQALMEQRHPANPFEIRTQQELLATSSGISGVLTVMLAGIAAVSLLVGGIGVMNIMLVSVTERTREIGVRKALGASRRVIQHQFLIEALVLSLTGGLIGIAMGVAGCLVASELFSWPLPVVPSAVLVAFIFAAAVGVGFGLYPAWRAASSSPSAALRAD